MTKNELARIINHKADIARIISVNYELNLIEGSLYDNKGKVESWSDRNLSTQAFIPESTGTIDYVIYANNVPCHLVDYTNQEETEILGAADCESEGEVLVREDAIFEIIDGPQEVDFEEMGYYIINLNFKGFKGE